MNNELKANKAVYYWLLAGVVMTMVQVALGGITRLTGSGLSITEWDVVTGALPPLNEAQWMQEFSKYQQTPQFKLLNADFNLSNFKFIFFWEWFHRLWARLIGLVFAAGFIYFLVRKKFQLNMIRPLIVLFVLGALQGLVGWIMVASGLEGDAVYVKPTRLALHFIAAMGLLSYTYWFALYLRIAPAERKLHLALKNAAIFILLLLVVQLVYGALMAGHKAATAAPTWPSINGYLLHPPGLVKHNEGWLNFIDNKIMIHWVHRMIAYALAVLVVWFGLRARKHQGLLQQYWWVPVALVALQVGLGIVTVLSSTGIVPGTWGLFEWMAQLHQIVGMLLLLSMVYMLYLTSGGKKAA
ncbi:MAG TPA: COX15/CtaA family protein [Phnomibacter sp.]|nr:COX15/CtaA family protein [Phnomibacter sp.]